MNDINLSSRGLPKQLQLTTPNIATPGDRVVRDLAIALVEAMIQLSPLEQEVLTLKKKHTCEEIAQILSLPDKQEAITIARAVFSKLVRCLEGLKWRSKDGCLGIPIFSH
jgi:hypothetical protein